MNLRLCALASAVALSSCGGPADNSATRSADATEAAPRGLFQKMIYDEAVSDYDISVIRDRKTGCQWIAQIYRGDVENTVPRNAAGPGGRIDQLCTDSGDPMTRPLRAGAGSHLFQVVDGQDFGPGLTIEILKDMETGCQWMVTRNYAEISSRDGPRVWRHDTINPRTHRTDSGTRQVCSDMAAGQTEQGR